MLRAGLLGVALERHLQGSEGCRMGKLTHKAVATEASADTGAWELRWPFRIVPN